MTVPRGRLAGFGDERAPEPPAGTETFVEQVAFGAVRIEQITSGAGVPPTEYCDDADEWVVVLAGAATVAVGAETFTLAAGDWLLLPAGTAHRVEDIEPGTRWLAVHHTPG